MKGYPNMTNITFEEFTAEFITKYELYLRTKHKKKRIQ